MKRTCNGCKALIKDKPYYVRCSLGYKISGLNMFDFTIPCKPLEECPKPRTFNELLECGKCKEE